MWRSLFSSTPHRGATYICLVLIGLSELLNKDLALVNAIERYCVLYNFHWCRFTEYCIFQYADSEIMRL